MLHQLRTQGRALGDIHMPSYSFADDKVEAIFELLKQFDERFHKELMRVAHLLDEVRFLICGEKESYSQELLIDVEVESPG